MHSSIFFLINKCLRSFRFSAWPEVQHCTSELCFSFHPLSSECNMINGNHFETPDAADFSPCLQRTSRVSLLVTSFIQEWERASFTAAVMLNCRGDNAGPIIALLKRSGECGYPAMLWANVKKRFTRRFMFLEYWAFIPVLREPALICQDGPSSLSDLDVCLRTGFATLSLCRKVQFSKGFEASCGKFVSKFCLG